jgi:hypothetical protein
LRSPLLGFSTANRFSFPGCCCCIAIPLVRNTLCQFVRSATYQRAILATKTRRDRDSPQWVYGAVNLVPRHGTQSIPFEAIADYSTGVQTRGAGAADHGIEDERHARLRALSRSVGAADGVPVTGRCRLLVNCAVSRGVELARSAHQPHTAGCLQLHSQTTGSDHHADRRTQHGPRRAPRAA